MKTLQRITLALSISALALLQGCLVLSLHPHFEDSDIVTDTSMAGTWESNKSNIWHFTPSEDGREYALKVDEGDGEVGHFIATPFQVKGKDFIDVYPATDDDHHSKLSFYYRIHRLPTHSLLYIDKTSSQFKVLIPQFGWLMKHLEAHPEALAHELVEDDFPIITASTKELQSFWLKHLKTEDAFMDLKLVKQATSNDE